MGIRNMYRCTVYCKALKAYIDQKPYMELCILLVLSEHYHTKNLERTGSNASIIYNVVIC